MSNEFRNASRGGKTTATSITTQQRSTCNVVIYRWDNTDITKIMNFNVAQEKSLAGKGKFSTKGNLNRKSTVLIRNDVIRCNISKNKVGSSGTFSLTLKKGKVVLNDEVLPADINYLDVIHSGDWIMIYMKKKGKISKEELFSTLPSSGLKFIGIVENVRLVEVDDPERGAPRLEYLVTGRDFGKIFDSSIYFNPQAIDQQSLESMLGISFLKDSTDVLKSTGSRKNFDKFTPDFVMQRLLSFYLGGKLDQLNVTHQTWYVPPLIGNVLRPKKKVRSAGLSFYDILDTSKIGLHKYKNGKFEGVSSLPGSAAIFSLPSSGTVWAVLDYLKNGVTNELFTELTLGTDGHLKPSLVLRQYPFSNKVGPPKFAGTNPFSHSGLAGFKWRSMPRDSQKTFFVDLPRYEIVSSEIRQKNVGKTDFERINHVTVVPRSEIAALDIAYVSSMNIPSIQRYGLKSFQAQTPYVLNSQLGTQKACQFFTDLVVDWFFLAHHLYNGVITVDGVEEHVEVGTNLYIKDIEQLYHIEGYSHTFHIEPSGRITYNTEFRVSRGQKFSNNLSSFISNMEEPTTITTSSLEGIRNA